MSTQDRDDQRRYITDIHYEYNGGADRLRPAYRLNIFPTEAGAGGGFRVSRPSRLPTTPRRT